MDKATLQLQIIDLSSSDSVSTANSIRQACTDSGFFYLVNHGIEEDFLQKVFEQSRNFFMLSPVEKMKVAHKNHTGYTPLFAEKLDTSLTSKGDSKESFYIGRLEDNLNQWPSEGTSTYGTMPELLPHWRSTMEEFHRKLLDVGKLLLSSVAMALNLDEDFFVKVGALDAPAAYLRLLHYPGELGNPDEQIYGASAHSDYGMITLLATDGVGGLQVCREKLKQPQVWEDVPHVNGAFIVNIGDMMERWTNCFFRSTLHRVLPTGRERYSMAFFLDPSPNCVVECLESCCSESSPPKYLPIRSGDYLQERLRLTYL